jgi:hypothetical protein
VGQLTLRCFVALIGLLQRCCDVISDETSKSINHPDSVNFDKILKKLLSDYAEALKLNKVNMFRQLKSLFRLTSGENNLRVRQILIDFFLSDMEEAVKKQSLAVTDSDLLSLLLTVWPAVKSEPEVLDLYSRVLASGHPAAQMILLDACSHQLLRQEGKDNPYILKLLLTILEDYIFAPNSCQSELRGRFLRKTGLAVRLAQQPEVVTRFSPLAGREIIRCAEELATYGFQPGCSSDLTSLLLFLGVLGQESGRPVLEPDGEAALLRLLAGRVGGTPELKAAACDLLSVELSHGGGMDLSECLPVIGSHIVSSAQSWQLRDSAIKVSINRIDKRRIPRPTTVHLPVCRHGTI